MMREVRVWRWVVIGVIIMVMVGGVFADGEQQEEQKEHKEEKETIPGAGLSIVFVFGGLLYSGILKAMCDKVNVPIP